MVGNLHAAAVPAGAAAPAGCGNFGISAGSGGNRHQGGSGKALACGSPPTSLGIIVEGLLCRKLRLQPRDPHRDQHGGCFAAQTAYVAGLGRAGEAVAEPICAFVNNFLFQRFGVKLIMLLLSLRAGSFVFCMARLPLVRLRLGCATDELGESVTIGNKTITLTKFVKNGTTCSWDRKVRPLFGYSITDDGPSTDCSIVDGHAEPADIDDSSSPSPVEQIQISAIGKSFRQHSFVQTRKEVCLMIVLTQGMRKPLIHCHFGTILCHDMLNQQISNKTEEQTQGSAHRIPRLPAGRPPCGVKSTGAVTTLAKHGRGGGSVHSFPLAALTCHHPTAPSVA